ncbi:MAG: nicotinate (nicotinamide) nucleotide adenylyltransferase [Clostridiales bacterium]|jgi:nicotinate-nucleotide adenylyltransferase|nr:nicotinate (nicotinamide) nucleotide adenylyltransferase [Clostridiales bacterium]
MKTGIYGGGFDPPHTGHMKAAKAALEFLKLDLLYIVPAFISPLKEAVPAAPPENRLEMCRIAFDFDNRIEISDFEINQGKVSYTRDTIQYFLNKYPKPENTIYLIIGTDQLVQLDKWKDYGYIFKNTRLAVVPRNKEGIPRMEVEKYTAMGADITEIDIKETEISSTEIRQGKNLKLLDDKVKEYIIKNGLYKQTD